MLPLLASGADRYVRLQRPTVERYYRDLGSTWIYARPDEIAQVERTVGGCVVEVTVESGERLSHRHDQDSYSYAIANVYVGGTSEDELIRKYEQAVAALPFEMEDVEEPSA